MAQVEWPRRYTICGTLAQVSNTNRFFIPIEDINYFKPKDAVYAVPSSDQQSASGFPLRVGSSSGPQVSGELYLQQGSNDPEMEFTLSADRAGTQTIYQVPTHFHIYKNAGVISSYPQYPTLVNESAQVVDSIYDRHNFRAYEVARPLFKGSVEIDAAWEEDAIIVQSFIDELADKDAWFELPLPGKHLGTASVSQYTSTTGNIRIPGSPERSANHLKGWYGRVGRRTCHIVYDDTIELKRGRVIFTLEQPATTVIKVASDVWNNMTDGEALRFGSVAGIDGSIQNNQPKPVVNTPYYVKKRSSNDELELYKNSNLTGEMVWFQQNPAPANFNLNSFTLGAATPYEDHLIRIVPTYLIDGTTSQADKNNFADVPTVRVRPLSISATGSRDYGPAPHVIDWVETDGN